MQILSFLDEDNELYIGFSYDSDVLTMKIADSSVYHLNALGDSLLDRLMVGWHRHCWSWESGGSFKVRKKIQYIIDWVNSQKLITHQEFFLG